MGQGGIQVEIWRGLVEGSTADMYITQLMGRTKDMKQGIVHAECKRYGNWLWNTV